MVEKKVIIPGTDYLTRKAVNKKEVPVEIRYPRRRECRELKKSTNCKLIIKKKVSEEQSEAYNHIFQADNRLQKRREYRRNRQVGKHKYSK